jgi:hypothetical protein
MTIDEDTLQEFMGTVLGDLGGATTVLMVCLGDELGLYEAMDGAGPMTAATLAQRTGCHERLVQEWLDQQAAAGYVVYDDSASTYTLPAEQALALARRQSPVFVASGMTVTASMFEDLGKVAAAFRTDGALAWGEHSEGLFRGTAEFFRPGVTSITLSPSGSPRWTGPATCWPAERALLMWDAATASPRWSSPKPTNASRSTASTTTQPRSTPPAKARTSPG